MSADAWETPDWVFSAASNWFGAFHLDVCASPENSKCAKFYDVDFCGLEHKWSSNNWCNPPYSAPRPWLDKAIVSARGPGWSTTLLLLADVSTALFSEAAKHADVYLLDQRIKFVGAKGSPPFGSYFARVTPATIRNGTIRRASIRGFQP